MIRDMICNVGSLLYMGKKKPYIGKPKRILVFRMGAIGDVLMTTPAVRLLRERFPDARIDYLVGDWAKAVLKGNDEIDEIISFDDLIIFRKRLSGIHGLIRKVRKRRYDMCIILERDYRFNVLASLFRIPLRIGFDRFGEGFANNYNIPYRADMYELEYNLKISEVIGGKVKSRKMRMTYSDEDAVFADRLLKGIKGKLVGVAPGGAKNPGDEASIKRWPTDSYISLIKGLKNSEVVLMGGPDDRDISDEITTKVRRRITDATGKASLQQTAALMSRCDVVVTHDSGPMHIAGAVCKSVVALFGPTPHYRFAPENAQVLRVKGKGCPCYDAWGHYADCKTACMSSISVDEVHEAVQNILVGGKNEG